MNGAVLGGRGTRGRGNGPTEAAAAQPVVVLDDAGLELGIHPLAAIEPPMPAEAARLIAHWRNLPKGRRTALKSAFDPIDLAPILNWIFICAREDAPDDGDFRFGVHGTGVADIVGLDLTHKTLRGILAEDAYRRVASAFEACLAHRLPVRHRLQSAFPGRGFIRVDRVVVPLEDETGAARHVLGVLTRCRPGDAARLTVSG